MLMKLNEILCDPPGITDEQKEINEREWRKPENWKGWIFPAYSSELDTRPFVPGRMFKPKTAEDVPEVICRQTPNKAHPRGRVWNIAVWVAVFGSVAAGVILMLLIKLNLI